MQYCILFDTVLIVSLMIVNCDVFVISIVSNDSAKVNRAADILVLNCIKRSFSAFTSKKAVFKNTCGVYL